MKYHVTGPAPIATKNGEVPPGGVVDDADLGEGALLDPLISAGHLKAAEDKTTKKPADK